MKGLYINAHKSDRMQREIDRMCRGLKARRETEGRERRQREVVEAHRERRIRSERAGRGDLGSGFL